MLRTLESWFAALGSDTSVERTTSEPTALPPIAMSIPPDDVKGVARCAVNVDQVKRVAHILTRRQELSPSGRDSRAQAGAGSVVSPPHHRGVCRRRYHLHPSGRGARSGQTHRS